MNEAQKKVEELVEEVANIKIDFGLSNRKIGDYYARQILSNPKLAIIDEDDFYPLAHPGMICTCDTCMISRAKKLGFIKAIPLSEALNMEVEK